MACALTSVCVLGLASRALASSGSPEEALGNGLVPYILGGQQTQASQVPWQVLVRRYEKGEVEEGICGGSIVSPTEILTAAHCVDHQDSTTPYAAADLTVVAGISNISAYLHFEVEKSGAIREPRLEPPAQRAAVASFRQHPYYNAQTYSDDIAVLTLSKPLTLSTAADTEAISLAPTGTILSPGTPLLVSGFGMQEASGKEPNGKLYSTTLEAVSPDACRETLGPDNSAIALCAVGASSATCQGDSGGAIVTTNPIQEVGLVDYGPEKCTPGQDSAFTNVTAPEVREFIEGSQTPPLAPRLSSPPVLKNLAVPVSYSPITCEAGGWTNSPTSYTYTFQAGEAPGGTVLQSGPDNIYLPPSTVVGSSITCILNASNAGGTATGRTGTSPAIVADADPPTSIFTGASCAKQTCTLHIAATDPNGVAIAAVTASAAYQVSGPCPKPARSNARKSKARKSKARHGEARHGKALQGRAGKVTTARHTRKGKTEKKAPSKKAASCYKTVSVPLSVTPGESGALQAVATRLPYKTKITFGVVASNAAGLDQAVPTYLSETIPKPKPKAKPKAKAKKRTRTTRG